MCQPPPKKYGSGRNTHPPRWNIAWALGKSLGLRPRDFPRAQAIFHRIPRLESQYSHSQSPLLANIFSYWGLLTSTSQYFLVLRPPDLRRPQYEKILASRGRSIVTVVFQYSIIWWLRMPITWVLHGLIPQTGTRAPPNPAAARRSARWWRRWRGAGAGAATRGIPPQAAPPYQVAH